MSTSTETRTPEEITEGTWRVRFVGRRENTGVIGGPRATLIATNEMTGMEVYEMGVSINKPINGTTMASATRIIEIAGFSDVLPILARRVDGDTVIDEFTFQQFR